jgi:hypothetical protein
MQQLYQRFTPDSPVVSHAAPQDAGEEQGVFLLGNGAIWPGEASLIRALERGIQDV